MSAYRGPAIDHSLLSPNGRMSRRARTAALNLQIERLGEGLDLAPPVQLKSDRIERLRRDLATIRARSAAGDRPRYHDRQAQLCEELIARLQVEAA